MHAVIDTRIGGVRQDQDCGHTSGQQNAIIISITTIDVDSRGEVNHICLHGASMFSRLKR